MGHKQVPPLSVDLRVMANRYHHSRVDLEVMAMTVYSAIPRTGTSPSDAV